MQTEEENRRLLQRIAAMEEDLKNLQGRMHNMQSVILSNISHDIRTPMNAIVGFANLLADESIDSKERNDFIDQINLNSTELLEKIDNMVDASMLQCGALKLFRNECYLNGLLDELYDTYRDHLEKSRKKLTISVAKGEDNGFFVVNDSRRLRQVLSNLIGNAVKFTGSGSVDFGYCRWNDSKIRFFVRDTGTGIDPFIQEDMFKPFQSRLHSGNDGINKGAGLGLALSKRLVELMGGELWPESVPGQGTCIYFTLPAEKNNRVKHKLQQLNLLTKRNIASLF